MPANEGRIRYKCQRLKCGLEFLEGPEDKVVKTTTGAGFRRKANDESFTTSTDRPFCPVRGDMAEPI